MLSGLWMQSSQPFLPRVAVHESLPLSQHKGARERRLRGLDSAKSPSARVFVRARIHLPAGGRTATSVRPITTNPPAQSLISVDFISNWSPARSLARAFLEGLSAQAAHGLRRITTQILPPSFLWHRTQVLANLAQYRPPHPWHPQHE